MDQGSLDPAGSQRTLEPTARDRGPKRSFASRLFGYDIFLSFALGPPPRGTHSYASDLARRLCERDFTVFFSEDEAPPGEQLDSTLRSALFHSKTLVVVANRGTLREPRYVRNEVQEFRKQRPHRPVIAINVGGALQELTVAGSAQDWLGQHGRIWLDESEESVRMGIASEEVVTRLATAPTRAKSNVKWKWVVRCVIAMLAALAIGLGVAAKVATNNARVSLSRQLAAQSTAELTSDRETSLLLAMRAIHISRTSQAEEALTNAVLAYPHRIALRAAAGPFSSVALSPDGKRAITASKDGSARYSSADTGERLAEVSGFDGPLYQVAFSPDGSLILGRGKSVLVWNTKTLVPVNSDLSRNNDVSDARFSPSGRFIVMGNRDGTASVWESQTGRRLFELESQGCRVARAEFNSTETSVVTAGDDGAARIWSVPTGKLIGELKGHTHRLISAEFSPDSHYVLTAASPVPINAEIELEERRTVNSDSPAGARGIGTPEPDNSVRIWNLTTGKVVVIRPAASIVIDAGFAPAGNAVWLGINFGIAPNPIGAVCWRGIIGKPLATTRERWTVADAFY